jgi:hypothetical protein
MVASGTCHPQRSGTCHPQRSSGALSGQGPMTSHEVIKRLRDGKSWWISFPGLDGVTSAADGPVEIATQPADALLSAVQAGMTLPLAIEDGAIPHYHIGLYQNPLVVLVPYTASASATAA